MSPHRPHLTVQKILSTGNLSRHRRNSVSNRNPLNRKLFSVQFKTSDPLKLCGRFWPHEEAQIIRSWQSQQSAGAVITVWFRSCVWGGRYLRQKIAAAIPAIPRIQLRTCVTAALHVLLCNADGHNACVKIISTRSKRSSPSMH